MKPYSLVMLAILASQFLTSSVHAENMIVRAVLISGGGIIEVPRVGVRATLGTPFSKSAGTSNHKIIPGVWLPQSALATAVGDTPPGSQLINSLSQNFPNPFNPRTEISFSTAQDESKVQLKIYDISGRLVRTLIDGPMPAGHNKVTWNGDDNRQRSVASGMYLYLLKTSTFQAQRKLILVR